MDYKDSGLVNKIDNADHTALCLLEIVESSLEDAKAEHISTYIRNIEVMKDGFKIKDIEHIKICTAKSTRHLRNIADRMLRDIKKAKYLHNRNIVYNAQGGNSANPDWICLYVGDKESEIIIHIMEEIAREEYQLDELMSQNKDQQVPLEDLIIGIQKIRQ